MKIYSGGQTGVDRAALDTAIQFTIPHAGWCPKGRKAEDGIIDAQYLLKETTSSDYLTRTRLNVDDSDATLILFVKHYDGGTKYTYDYAIQNEKPILTVNLEENTPVSMILDWLDQNNISVLNIAGPRESKQPGIYLRARKFLAELFRSL